MEPDSPLTLEQLKQLELTSLKIEGFGVAPQKCHRMKMQINLWRMAMDYKEPNMVVPPKYIDIVKIADYKK